MEDHRAWRLAKGDTWFVLLFCLGYEGFHYRFVCGFTYILGCDSTIQALCGEAYTTLEGWMRKVRRFRNDIVHQFCDCWAT